MITNTHLKSHKINIDKCKEIIGDKMIINGDKNGYKAIKT